MTLSPSNPNAKRIQGTLFSVPLFFLLLPLAQSVHAESQFPLELKQDPKTFQLELKHDLQKYCGYESANTRERHNLQRNTRLSNLQIENSREESISSTTHSVSTSEPFKTILNQYLTAVPRRQAFACAQAVGLRRAKRADQRKKEMHEAYLVGKYLCQSTSKERLTLYWSMYTQTMKAWGGATFLEKESFELLIRNRLGLPYVHNAQEDRMLMLGVLDCSKENGIALSNEIEHKIRAWSFLSRFSATAAMVPIFRISGLAFTWASKISISVISRGLTFAAPMFGRLATQTAASPKLSAAFQYLAAPDNTQKIAPFLFSSSLVAAILGTPEFSDTLAKIREKMVSEPLTEIPAFDAGAGVQLLSNANCGKFLRALSEESVDYSKRLSVKAFVFAMDCVRRSALSNALSEL
ncbi:MAG: hypothetical protein COT74_00180 [Bdellovibrionales bacterium CG10_big_fil_rev_8_21_14_0_10_45_34]|nr:MAG: hypothetical protein COT74_00180 [Bdellovibrionales bacterium CG10_big_fil_rev_8_21_14_0_10_45_34]